LDGVVMVDNGTIATALKVGLNDKPLLQSVFGVDIMLN